MRYLYIPKRPYTGNVKRQKYTICYIQHKMYIQFIISINIFILPDLNKCQVQICQQLDLFMILYGSPEGSLNKNGLLPQI